MGFVFFFFWGGTWDFLSKGIGTLLPELGLVVDIPIVALFIALVA